MQLGSQELSGESPVGGRSLSLVVAPASLSQPSASASHPEAQSSQPREVKGQF